MADGGYAEHDEEGGQCPRQAAHVAEEQHVLGRAAALDLDPQLLVQVVDERGRFHARAGGGDDDVVRRRRVDVSGEALAACPAGPHALVERGVRCLRQQGRAHDSHGGRGSVAPPDAQVVSDALVQRLGRRRSDGDLVWPGRCSAPQHDE